MTTSKDKTGDQLVASMRKSKTGAVARKTTSQRTPSNPPAATNQVTATNTASDTKPVRKDGYSHGRRVWPD